MGRRGVSGSHARGRLSRASKSSRRSLSQDESPHRRDRFDDAREVSIHDQVARPRPPADSGRHRRVRRIQPRRRRAAHQPAGAQPARAAARARAQAQAVREGRPRHALHGRGRGACWPRPARSSRCTTRPGAADVPRRATTIVVGSTEHAAEQVLPEMIRALSEAFPGVTTRFEIGRSTQLAERSPRASSTSRSSSRPAATRAGARSAGCRWSGTPRPAGPPTEARHRWWRSRSRARCVSAR